MYFCKAGHNAGQKMSLLVGVFFVAPNIQIQPPAFPQKKSSNLIFQFGSPKIALARRFQNFLLKPFLL